MHKIFYRIGLRHITSKPWRTLLTTLGIALGVALYIGIHIINQSTLQSFRETIDSMSGKATLTVFGGDAGFAENKLEIVQKVNGVTTAVPLVSNRAYLVNKEHATESLMILGIDLLKEQSVRRYKTTDERVIEDPFTFLNQPDSIIVTRSFAEAHHLQVDSSFDVATASGHKKLTVRGLLTPEGVAKAYGGSLAIMDIDGARMTFGKENKIDRIDIVTTAQADIDAVAENLRQALGAGYRVEKPETQSQNVEKLIGSYQAMLAFFSTLALVVGLFFVSNSMSTAVSERRREIGTLRALGATRNNVLVLFLIEAGSMGIVGASIGVAAGRGIAGLLVKMVTRSISIQYTTQVQTTHLIFGWAEVTRGIAIGTMAAVIAALWPSFKAATICPLTAMKKNQVLGLVRRKFRLGLGFTTGLAFIFFFILVSFFHWGARSPLIETFSEIASIVGPALVGPAIVARLLGSMRKVAVGPLGAVSRLAKDNLMRNPKRTGSNVTILMVGLVLIIIIGALDTSFKSSITTWIDRSLRHDLMVTSYGNVTMAQNQPLREELGKQLRTISGVKMSAGDNVGAFRMIHLLYEGRQITLKAFDPPLVNESYDFFDVKDRPSEQAGRDLFQIKNTLLVSENFAAHFNKKTGDTTQVATPTGKTEFRIVGTIIDFASPEGVVYISRPQYKALWSDALVDGFGLHLLPGYDLATVRHAIDEKFGMVYNIMTMSNSDLRGAILKNIDDSLAYTRAIEGLALFVALLSLLNTFMMNVIERTRELGMLRAVGMSRSQIRWMIMHEALLQGTFGALIAMALGAGISYIWVSHSLSQLLGWTVSFAFPWTGLIVTGVAAVVVPLVAGFYPAYRASNIEICQALDHD